MLIVGIVQNKDEAIEIEKIYETFIVAKHIQYVSRQNQDWKYATIRFNQTEREK